jgi:hypothetical protein
MGTSGDGSMEKSNCDVSIVHSELTKGVPKLVQDIYDDLYASCVDVGSNGQYKSKMERHLGASTGNRVLQEQVDAEEEGGRELMTCNGPCASSATLTYSQCNNCCLASITALGALVRLPPSYVLSVDGSVPPLKPLTRKCVD